MFGLIPKPFHFAVHKNHLFSFYLSQLAVGFEDVCQISLEKKVSSYSWVCPCRISHTLSQWIIETGDRFAQPHHSYVLHMHKLLCTQRLCSRTLHFDEIENFIRLLCTREQTNHRWHVWVFFFCLCFCRTNCVFGILRAFFGRKPSLHIHTHTMKWRSIIFAMIRFYLYCAINFNS